MRIRLSPVSRQKLDGVGAVQSEQQLGWDIGGVVLQDLGAQLLLADAEFGGDRVQGQPVGVRVQDRHDSVDPGERLTGGHAMTRRSMAANSARIGSGPASTTRSPSSTSRE